MYVYYVCTYIVYTYTVYEIITIGYSLLIQFIDIVLILIDHIITSNITLMCN